MSSRMFLPAFLLWAWAAGGTTNAISCGQCERGTHSMICPNSISEEQYTVKLLSNRILQLDCQKSARGVIDYSLIEDCHFPSVNEVEFRGCPFPSSSLAEAVLKVGLYPKNITKLKFIDGVRQPEANTEDWHLNRLNNLEFLELINNNFSSVPVNLFNATPKLKFFKFTYNNLDTIPETLFSSLLEITTIDLSSNGLASVPVNLFANLTRLTIIDLQNNELNEIRSELFSNQPHLVNINLNNNYISNIQRSLFVGMKYLQILNIGGNKLERLPHDVFYNMTALTTLDLSSNLLTALEPRSFDNNREMKTLNLGNNSLISLPDELFQRCESLQTLYLNHNQLAVLNKKWFRRRSALAYIDLGNNNIEFSTTGYLGNSFALDEQDKLKTIILNDNKLTTIPHSFHALYLKLEAVDLSGNLIEEVAFSSLHFQNNHVKFNLSNNMIKSIHLFQSWPVMIEKIVKLSLKGNPLLCNCNMYNFLNLIHGKPLGKGNLFKIVLEDGDQVTCTNQGNEIKKLMDVDTETLTCKMLLPCDNCTCYWRSSDSMIIVDCSYQGRSEIPKIDFDNYGYKNSPITINMRNNSITSLDALQDPSYRRLVNLTIPNNKLSFINESYLPEKLKVLNICGNNLTSLSGSLLKFLNVTDMHLSLGNNPWTCNCDLIDFLNFLYVPLRKVDDFDDIRCKDQDEPLITLSEHSLCPFFMQPMVIVTIVAILIFLILFAVLGTVSFYKYKQGIKVWLFTHRVCLWAVTEDEMDADKKYDAFISYSHKDEEFVNKILVPGLECGDPKYRVCLHYRDWIPGEYIQNQIMQSVEASRRTIVVLSSNFIESVWGQLEFKAAHSQALQDKTNRLIVIVYGELLESSHLINVVTVKCKPVQLLESSHLTNAVTNRSIVNDI
ncbi:toll-like receptor Toll2-like 2 [Homarus americanus]|uniref:Toll-like receptor Toll2-like 2 n=1 Tax=Homarus americanus TaxID=6706 RepID=A0A8J5N717_HOMAM|nr:toll-like receptor Toll2-like 2 [Homarus americanus]